jgi:hypothetical protein
MRQSRARVSARIGALLLATLALPAVIEAHAIHTTLTVLTASPVGVTLTIRAFADDFSASVAKFNHRTPPTDSSASRADVEHYVRSTFELRDAQGRALQLASCGVQRLADLYWLCFRTALPAGVAGVVVRNQMLTEYHADQVNIIQIDDRGARRTLLFTKTSTPSPIASS